MPCKPVQILSNKFKYIVIHLRYIANDDVFFVFSQILSSSFEIKEIGGHFEVQNRTLKFLYGSLETLSITAYIKVENIS
jgi:hypothetical protein